MKNKIIIGIFIISLLSLACFGAEDLQFEGKSIDAWLKLLTGRPEQPYGPSPSKEIQRQALAAVQRMGKREYDFLVEQLTSTNADIGIIPIAFKVAGSNAVPEIPTLIETLDHETSISWMAAECLKSIGTNSIPPLIAALDNKKVRIRENAAYALGQIGPPAGIAVPKLLERLSIDELPVRCQILTALGLINQYPEKVVPAVIPYLSNKDSSLRGNAAFTMIGFGKNAKAAAPKLFKLMSDDNETVCGNAAGALEHMEAGMGKDYVTLLESNASNPDLKIREYISQELSKRGVNTNSAK